MARRRAQIRKFAAWGLLILLFITGALYGADTLLFTANAEAGKYGKVRVTPYYAVERKDHKIEFMFDEPRDETCVNSLFPREGDTPCWYLRKHKERRTNI